MLLATRLKKALLLCIYFLLGLQFSASKLQANNLTDSNICVEAIDGYVDEFCDRLIVNTIPEACPELELYIAERSLPNTLGILKVIAYGGTPPYKYTSSFGKDLGYGSFNVGCYGGYGHITMTDANACSITLTDVFESLEPTAYIDYKVQGNFLEFSITNKRFMDDDYSELRTNIPGGFIDNTLKTVIPPPGTYYVAFDASNDCFDKFVFKKNIEIGSLETCETLELELSTFWEDFYDYENHRQLRATVTGGTPPYSYTFDGVNLSEDGTIGIGCYGDTVEVVVTDAMKCSVTDSIIYEDDFIKNSDITFTIYEDYIQFHFEDIEQYIAYIVTTLPGKLDEHWRIPRPAEGEYTIRILQKHDCARGQPSKTFFVEAAEDCENEIDMDVVLGTQAQINNFVNYYACSGCTTINGSLHISGEDIWDLRGLSFLTGVRKNIRINNCPKLRRLEGLNYLSNIEQSLILNNLPQLENLDGLNGAAIKKIGANLVIRKNNNLVDISALKGIDSIGRHLLIRSNFRLTQIEGLQNIKYIGGVFELEDLSYFLDCTPICELITEGHIGRTIRMSGTPPECKNPNQVLKSCADYPPDCDYYADFTYTINGLSVQFSAVESPDSSARYLWNLGYGEYKYADSPEFTFTFSRPGSYAVNLKVLGSCKAGITQTITVSAPTTICKANQDNNEDSVVDNLDAVFCDCIQEDGPTAKFDFNIVDNEIHLLNTSTDFSGSSKWISPFKVNNNLIKVPSSISFNVCLEIENNCFKKDTYCQTISLGSGCENTEEQFVENRNIDFKLATQPVNKRTLIQGNIYPNPAINQLKIVFDLPQASKVNLQLFSFSGQQSELYLNQVPYENGEHQLEISLANLPAGMYLMHLQTNSGIWKEKLVKLNE